MTKSNDRSSSSSRPSCGCANCQCSRGPRCLCHDNNALLALALWDFGRAVRRNLATEGISRRA